MKVGDVIEIIKVSSLNNLAVARNDAALMKFIYLGVSELYRRFNLSIKTETVVTNPNLTLYELKSKNVSLLLDVYNTNGKKLQQTDVINGHCDYKILNYKSFLLTKPKNDLLFAVYKASPETITDTDTELELPDAMIDALLTYVGYLGHSTINKDNINESSAYSKRFDTACSELEAQGYRIDINSEYSSLVSKGFV